MQSSIKIHYCQHFQYFKANKKLKNQNKSFCKFCTNQNCPLWLCLYKNCGVIVCGKSNHKHLTTHLQQSKKMKSFHSIYINIRTAQIRCQHCDIQIYDLQKLPQNDRKKIMQNGQYNNPLRFRYAFLPCLADIGQVKLMGQLQFSEGHQKINKGLVGIFADRYNYSILSAVQFISHCDYFRQIILNIKTSSIKDIKKKLLLQQIQNVIQSIENAKQRAIRIQELCQYLVNISQQLQGYKLKNPFQNLLFILNIIHQVLNYYKVIDKIQNFGQDEWDLFYKHSKIQSHCPIYDSLKSTIKFEYKCMNCKYELNYDHFVNFLTFDFPKTKRKNKIIQKQLNEKGYQSPRKRGKSLISLILPESDLPITIPELFIDFLKRYLHPEKYCPQCKNKQIPMKPINMTFKKLADILIIHINRFSKVTQSVNQTQIMMDYGKLNLRPFCNHNIQSQKKEGYNSHDNQVEKLYEYEFCTSIGIDNGIFPVVCKSKNNGQIYIIKNQVVQMLGNNKFNPYVICLKRKSTLKTKLLYQQILESKIQTSQIQQNNMSNHKTQLIQLPDFYDIQLKYGVQNQFFQPMSCKHGKIKPNVESKCKFQALITKKMSEKLISNFKGESFVNQICSQCIQQIQAINNRKIKQKQIIKDLDKIKSNTNVMISLQWLKKWTHYLYSNDFSFYFHKGFPLPPPIDNKTLLDDKKCRSDLIKNKDFKVINIFIYKFLKQLYGGGLQIRYKWNNQLKVADELKIKQLKLKAITLKTIYSGFELQQSKKSSICQKNSNYMETVNQSQIQESISDVNCQN